ncbi:MAG: SUMF1/EgtB/PvdO family nonheme iron enzyme, partial [Myxococcota bacterium]
LPVLAALIYGAVQLHTQRELDRRVEIKIERGQGLHDQARDKTAELEGLRQRAFAAFNSQRSEEGEALWTQVVELAATANQLYREASQVFEAGLVIDSSRIDVRDMLGEVLLERALAAERDHNTALRDELLERLKIYDLDSEFSQRWTAPARLELSSQPSGAQVVLEEYVTDENQRLQLTHTQILGETPVRVGELAPGSYRLSLSMAGRATVHYPVALRREEVLELDIHLPPTATIPDGFVYVPPGRFLFGSALPRSLRQQFLSAVPIHESRTEGYLIAQHETTYGEWIEYLDSLTPEEQVAQGITVGEGDPGGVPSLRRQEDGSWLLTLQPGSETYQVVPGEKIVYKSRKARTTHDWLRLPVSGISFTEASAYARWLDHPSRLPGARLCTDFEWERAARGADDRLWPFGNRFSIDDANVDVTYGRQAETMGPDEVGSRPESRSPFEVEEMAGNVLEWGVSSLKANEVIIRGSSYFYSKVSARASNRTVGDPNFR